MPAVEVLGRRATAENSTLPLLSWAILSCSADLNGATPVPGPTIITALAGSLGNLSKPFFTHSGTWTSPRVGSKEASQVEQRPLRGFCSLVLYLTTARRMWILLGCASSEEAMEKERGWISGKRSSR
uniref:Uncharacterized protein n=1 Tax=Anguilla anguilla TaxID=7936 RepID=A0A0E9RUY4_ANGAN